MAQKTLLQSLDHLLRLPEGTLTGPEELAKIKSWDSLAIIEYISLVDEMYGIDIPPDKVRQSKVVQDLLNLAEQRVPR